IATGAGSGIGRAIALRLGQLGAAVTGLGRHEETLAETGSCAAQVAKGSGAYDYRVCNVRDTEAATAAVVEVGEERGLDLLVNNDGGQFFAPAVDVTLGGWNAVIDLNLTSVFHLILGAYAYLARTSGSVQNISLYGVERGGM